jgi:hypothetical protein
MWLAVGGVPQVLAAPAAVPEKDRKFVSDTLAAIDPNDPGTAAAAEKALVARGETIVPALEAALAAAEGPARAVVDGALVSLVWKIDPSRLIREWVLKQNKDFEADLHPALLSDATLGRELPDWRFYVVAFRQYPVAMMPPEPLDSRNVFAVAKSGAVELLGSQDALKKFFAARLPAVKEERDAKDAVITWLVVSKELTSDGMMRFTIPQDQVKAAKTAAGWQAEGAAVLGGAGRMGDRGSIRVTISFDDKGAFKDAVEDVKMQRGMRPICQATKLLDADPIVRKIARQDLLVMGAAAREYLMAQRAKAAPELHDEIDRVWREILDLEREWESWSQGR